MCHGGRKEKRRRVKRNRGRVRGGFGKRDGGRLEVRNKIIKDMIRPD
jgi:hypothetical protein